MMRSFAVDGAQFTLDGHPANDGHRIRGASLSGIVLGIDIGPDYAAAEISTLTDRAARAGLNAVSIALPSKSDVRRGDSRGLNLNEIIMRVAESGLVPFMRVAATGVAWRDLRLHEQGTSGDSGLIEYVADATRRLASVVSDAFAVIIDLPPGPLSQDTTTRALITAARGAANGRGLVGTRDLPDGDGDGVTPDFLFMRRPRRDREPGKHSLVLSIPTIRSGDGSDLDDPDGELGQALSDGASWFLRVGYRAHPHAHTREPIDAFLETVRAARAGGHAPSDHPTVALADLRHTFRRHADAIRGLNLAPANAPGSGPR